MAFSLDRSKHLAAALTLVAVLAVAAAIPSAAVAGSPVSALGQVASGWGHTCAVMGQSQAICWGEDSYGQASAPDFGTRSVKQISAGLYNACALISGGVARCWGDDGFGQSTVPSFGGRKVEQVGTGGGHSCVLLDDGAVRCWGNDFFGQAAVPDFGGRKAMSISVGDLHSCAVLDDGGARCWGDDEFGQSSPPDFTSRSVLQVTTGVRHSCALLSDGSVHCWGMIDDVPADVPDLDQRAAEVSAGTLHTCALLDDGTLTCWGDGYGCRSRLSGEPSCWGEDYGGWATMPDFHGLKAIDVSSGVTHTCAMLEDRSVTCWGFDIYGQTDVPTDVDSPDVAAPAAPLAIAGLPDSPTRDTRTSISFHLAEPDGQAECRVDSGEWAPCTSVDGSDGTFEVSGLVDGRHRVAVRQIDAAGNVGAQLESDSWTVDSTPPAKPAFAGVPTSSRADSASLEFTGEDGASFSCSLDGSTFVHCSSPARVTRLKPGAHRFSIMAVDAAGNESEAAAAEWTVQPPPLRAPSLLAVPAGTKTLVRDARNHRWLIFVGKLFSTSGDTRSAADFKTLQIAVGSDGRPVSEQPADGAPYPTSATIRQGVVAWRRVAVAAVRWRSAPVWVRIQNMGGEWSQWTRLVR